MLTIITDDGQRFFIPVEANFVQVRNCHMVTHNALSEEPFDVEYGDLVFETAKMRCVFREMKNPRDFCREHLQKLSKTKETVLFLEQFDPSWGYDSLEMEMLR